MTTLDISERINGYLSKHDVIAGWILAVGIVGIVLMAAEWFIR